MSINLTINGVAYPFPVQGDSPPWGSQVTAWAQAVTGGMLQKAGGTFTLTADTDFGGSYGLKALKFSTRTANPASSGLVRAANSDVGIAWRNAANNADLALGVNSSNQLTFDGQVVAQPASSITWRNRGLFLEDFFGIRQSGADLEAGYPWEIVQTNGTVALTYNGAGGTNPGVIRLETGTNVADLASIYSPGSDGWLELGDGGCLFEANVRLPVANTLAQRYNFIIGLASGAIGGPIDFIGFDMPYTGADVNKIRAVTEYNGFGTAASTPLDVLPAPGTFFRLGISINADRTALTAYVDGTQVYTVTTSYISPNPLAPVAYIYNAAGANGKNVDIDYICIDKTLDPER